MEGHKGYNISTHTSTAVEINSFSKLYFYYSLFISFLGETISLEKGKENKSLQHA